MKTQSNLLKSIVAAALVTAVVFTGCKKDNNNSSMSQAEQQEYATNSSRADAESEAVFDDVLNNVLGVSSDVAIGGTGVFARKATPQTNAKETGTDGTPCFTVSYTKLNGSNAFPLQVTIDFGAGCTGNDGHIRQGKMIVVYSGHLIMPGNSATTTFDGFYIDSFKVEGTHKVTNTSTQDKRSFTIDITNAKLTKPNGNFNTWSSTKTITQTGGLNTPLILADDVFSVTGQASGTLQRGDRTFTWQTAITSPLIKKFACPFISQGTITISHNNTQLGVLDYGTGQCDRKATLTVNGVIFEISLV